MSDDLPTVNRIKAVEMVSHLSGGEDMSLKDKAALEDALEQDFDTASDQAADDQERLTKVDFSEYMAKHNPEVVIFDVSPPYEENWKFFKTMRQNPMMKDRGVVLTTTNKDRLDEVLGEDSHAVEIVGKTDDLHQIDTLIRHQTPKAESARLAQRRINFA
jgi:DNA-binding response OmpR family regulator